MDKLVRLLGNFDENLNFLSSQLSLVAYVDGVKIILEGEEKNVMLGIDVLGALMKVDPAVVIDESKIQKDKVQILSKVTLLNHNNKREVTYTIVSENEANLREGKLAIGTPIAKALLGKKKGEVVEVTVPAGVIKFEILDISI